MASVSRGEVKCITIPYIVIGFSKEISLPMVFTVLPKDGHNLIGMTFLSDGNIVTYLKFLSKIQRLKHGTTKR